MHILIEYCRKAIVVGTTIPIALFLIWDAVILGTIPSLAKSGTIIDLLEQLRSRLSDFIADYASPVTQRNSQANVNQQTNANQYSLPSQVSSSGSAQLHDQQVHLKPLCHRAFRCRAVWLLMIIPSNSQFQSGCIMHAMPNRPLDMNSAISAEHTKGKSKYKKLKDSMMSLWMGLPPTWPDKKRRKELKEIKKTLNKMRISMIWITA
ncbi:hypothetical protein GUJ93_ZPchr0007g5571 [Zizania palustris]|uniref:Uncharacterized protein n=1 Tax=Zizania palustris TaxID=103762 RepID=A0A8J5SU40_ZIZPA|nr:hypothetical protein GUJ93_ZPchr0007g5571 [Zizania palustris]